MKPHFVYLIGGLLAALLFGSPAAADARADGAQAYARGEYDVAHRIWEPLAALGDAELQFKVGAMYEWGTGVPTDFREAVKWYHRAARQGHVEAQFTLGVMYGSGTGVRQDDVLAWAWYDVAAAQGDEAARDFRDVTTQKLGREQITQARQIARDLRNHN